MAMATLNIEIYVYCPKCENSIDLLDDGYNDDNEVMKQACPTDGTYWYESHKDFKVNNVYCDKCEHEFTVEGMEY